MHPQGPPRLGPSFKLLMQVRALVTAITLLPLSSDHVDVITTLLVIGLTVLYWLAGWYWERIVPRVVAHPLLTGIDLFVSFAVLSFGGPNGPFFQSTVIAAAVAGLLFHWRGMLLVSVSQIICYFAAFGYYTALLGNNATAVMSFQTLASQPAYYLIVGLVGVMLRRLFDEQAATEEARREADARTVAADERARLAREMHDSLAKTLRGIAMSAQALPVWVRKSPGRAADEARRIASSAEVASREARDLITDLRDDQVQHPLVNTVADVVAQWSEGSGMATETELDASVDLPLVARYELIAILKESLTNIQRHAEAGTVTVRLTGPPEGGLTLTVQDDGVGFAAPVGGPDWLDVLARAGHYGVVGMHERAKRAGADLRVRSAPHAGTTLTVSFPDRAVIASEARPDSNERQPAEAG